MPLPQIPLDDPRVLALAKARQQFAHDCTHLPTWEELTDEEREDSLPGVRNYLEAAINAGLIPTPTAAEQPPERPAEAAAANLLKAAEHLREVLVRYRTPSWPDYSGMAPPRVAAHIAHALEVAAAAARELSSQGWIDGYTEDTDTLAPHLPALEQAVAGYSRSVRELP